MLEQAIPRLRDMLAGQGIQLGQTVVQQQAQQQAFQQQGAVILQGQSGFGDQGRQGGNGGGSDGREEGGRSATSRCWWNRQTMPESISMLDAFISGDTEQV